METVKLIAQIVVALSMVLNFFFVVHGDFKGRSARPAGGFDGFIASLVIVGLMVIVLYLAGAFSMIVG